MKLKEQEVVVDIEQWSQFIQGMHWKNASYRGTNLIKYLQLEAISSFTVTCKV